VDKNEILDKIKAERGSVPLLTNTLTSFNDSFTPTFIPGFDSSDANEKLAEENRKLHLQTVEQKQQLEELQGRLKSCSRVRGFTITTTTTTTTITNSHCIQSFSVFAEGGAPRSRAHRGSAAH